MYFFTNMILRNIIEETVKIESKGIYTLNFDYISFKYIKKSIILKQVHLKPDTSIYNKLKKQNKIKNALYDIKIPELKISGFNLNRLYFNKNLEIKMIFLKNPDVYMVAFPHHPDSTKKKNHNIIKKDIHHFITSHLSSLIIDEINIKNGFFDYYKSEGDINLISSIKNISILLKDLQIDSIAYEHADKIFFADDVEIELSDYDLVLSDSLHIFNVGKINISTTDSSILASEISIFPEKSKIQKSNKNNYQVNIPEIKITGIDITEALKNKNIQIDSININKPEIILVSGKTSKTKKHKFNYKGRNNIYSLIAGKIKSIDIGNFRINNSDIILFNNQTDSLPDISINDLCIEFENFRLDSSSFQNFNKISYSDNILMTIKDFEMKLSDNIHLLKAHELLVSSFDSEVLAKSIKISPHYLTGNQIKESKHLLYNIFVPDFKIKNINIREVYNYKILPINIIEITNPDIQIKNYKKQKSNPEKKPNNTNSILSEYLNEIIVDTFRLTNGTFNISHQINSDFFNLYLNRIDILNVYFDKKLSINEILIKQPKFKLTYFEKFKKTQNKSENNNKIQEILNSHLEFIKINKIIAENGSFNLCKNGTENIFDEKNIAVKITGFYLDDETLDKNDRILFSEDIEILIKDYTFNFPDKKHRLTTDEIGISIAGSQIFAKEINIFPVEEINTPADIKMLYKIHSPELTLSGIDFNKVYFKKIIQIDKIYLKTPDINLSSILEDTAKTENKQHGLSFNITLPKNINSLHIPEFIIKNGKLSLINKTGKTSNTFLKSDFNIDITGINLYSENQLTKANPLIADNIFIRLDNNQIFFKDSLHFVEASEVTLSTLKSEIIFKDISFKPVNNQIIKNLLVKSGKSSTYDVTIDGIQIKGLEFEKMVTDKVIDINQLNFNNSSVILTHYPELKHPQKKTQKELNLYENFKHLLKSIQIHNIDFDDISITSIKKYSDSTKKFSINRISGDITNFHIDSTHQEYRNRLFYTDDIKFNINDYSFTTGDSMYTVYAGKINISTALSQLYLDSFRLIPNYSKYDFSRKLGYQTDRMDISAESIIFDRMNFSDLIIDKKINIGLVNVNKLDLYDFRDKRVTFPEWQKRSLPQSMIRKADIYLKIDTIQLNQAHIIYSEKVEKSKGDGEVIFDNMFVTITDITNDKELVSNGAVMKAGVTAYLMGQSLLFGQLEFPLASKQDTFYFKATLSKMDISNFNSMTENLFGVAIKRGKGGIRESIVMGNNDYATGTLVFPYRRLKIAMMNKETGKRGGIGDGILTFLANNILIKSNNPKFGRKIRVGEIYCRRNKQKSFFNYLWKSQLSGIESTFGFNTKEQRKEKKELKKQQKGKTNRKR